MSLYTISLPTGFDVVWYAREWSRVLYKSPNAIHPYEWEDWHHTMDRRIS